MLTDEENPVALTEHDREVLWQTLGQCFSCAPNSPESCDLVDAMVEQIVASHLRARVPAALREAAGSEEFSYGVVTFPAKRLRARADSYDRIATTEGSE